MLEKSPDMIQYVFIFVAFRIIYNLTEVSQVNKYQLACL